MSPERRAQYEARRNAMKPGSKAGREMAKRDREARAMFATSAPRPAAPDPEAEALAAEIARLHQRLLELQPPTRATETSESINTSQRGNTDD